jgi:hypothetical protein
MALNNARRDAAKWKTEDFSDVQHVKTSCRIPGMVWRKSEYYVLSFLAEIAYNLILKELATSQ